MNRRQLIRNGLVAVGGMTAGASGVLRSELVLAQTQPLPHPTRPPQPIPPISPAKIWSPAIPTSKSVEEMTVGFGLSPKGSVTVATVKATDAVKKLPNMVPISASRAILISTNPDVPPVAKEEIPNQFFAFQAAFLDGSPTVLTPNDVEPSIQTGETAPDVLLDVSLASFHLSESDGVNKDARAQLRLTINNEADTERARKFDIVYWAITTGLYLFDDQLKTRIPKLNSSDLKADFRKALGNRSIELPGGIGSIKFEVIRHKEPPWWRKIFTFGSEGGKALTAVLGFPALTADVLEFVDKVANSFERTDSEVLFTSRPLKFAFSKQARDVLTANGTLPVKAGVLNPGIWLLARGRDLDTLTNAKASYFETHGLLVPSGVSENDLVHNRYEDPFKDVTYAVLKATIRPHKICRYEETSH